MTLFKPNIGRNLLCLSRPSREQSALPRQLSTWSYVKRIGETRRQALNANYLLDRNHLLRCQKLGYMSIHVSPRSLAYSKLIGGNFESELFDHREFVDMELANYISLFEDDMTGEIEVQIERILKDYEYAKYNTAGRVPTNLSIDDMKLLLQEGTTEMSRARLFNYFFKREMTILAQQKKKAHTKAEIEKKKLRKESERLDIYGNHGRTGLVSPNGRLLYGLWHNSLFPRITWKKCRMKNTLNNLIRANLEKRTLVFDFDYEEYMKHRAVVSLGDQIQSSYGINRYDYEEPFDLWFCNLKKDSESARYMEKTLPHIHDTVGSMITVKEDCFTNYFDRRNLVYLSPHAPERLQRVESGITYVLGAFNDKGITRPVSYKKALSKNIVCKSLPLDEHLAWQGSSKSLCMNHVVGVLLECYKNNNDWGPALRRHIPVRKIKSTEQVMEEQARRVAKMKAYLHRPVRPHPR